MNRYWLSVRDLIISITAELLNSNHLGLGSKQYLSWRHVLIDIALKGEKIIYRII